MFKEQDCKFGGLPLCDRAALEFESKRERHLAERFRTRRELSLQCAATAAHGVISYFVLCDEGNVLMRPEVLT